MQHEINGHMDGDASLCDSNRSHALRITLPQSCYFFFCVVTASPSPSPFFLIFWSSFFLRDPHKGRKLLKQRGPEVNANTGEDSDARAFESHSYCSTLASPLDSMKLS